MKFNKAFIGGSLVLLVTFNIFNVLNFIFQFSMARLLSVVEYGVLAALFSIIYIFDVFKESIQTVITKYSSTEKDMGKLKYLFSRSTNRLTIVASITFVLFLVLSIFLSPLLKISYLLLAMTGSLIFLSSLIPISRGLMLGRKMFKSLGLNLITEASIKLILSIVLVILGWSVYGAITATFIGAFLALLLSFSSLKAIIKSKAKQAETIGIYSYSIPVFFITAIIILFYSLDVIIAKIVFSPELAGYYALASILGKTIFWGTQPISRAMFPLSAESKSNKGRNLFLNAFVLSALLIIMALTLFYLFPEFILHLFSGKSDISQAASILLLVGIAFSIQSISNLILLYKLSKGKTKNYLYSIIFILIEVALLFMFSSSLIEFSIAYIISSLIFLLGYLIILKK